MATNFFKKIIKKIKTMNELKIVFQRPSVVFVDYLMSTI